MTTTSTIYLSRLEFPADSPRWQFLNHYQLKQVLHKSLGDGHGRFLFRLDPIQKGNARVHSVLVQSLKKPVGPIAGDHEVGFETKEMNLGGLTQGRLLRFFVRANATRTYTSSVDRKKYRLPIGAYPNWQAQSENVPREDIPDRETQVVDWLKRQGAGKGFDLVAASVAGFDRIQFRKSSDQSRSAPPISINTTDISGILEISDSAAFRKCLCEGLGKARSFGCGLLSLAPA